MREVRLSPSGGFDNGPEDYRHIAAHPVASAMGAEITGPRLCELGDEGFAELQRDLQSLAGRLFNELPLLLQRRAAAE